MEHYNYSNNTQIERYSILDHSDYLSYLKKIVERNIRLNIRPFTNGEWAKRLGYQSPRSFGMILSGERLPSLEMIQALASYLKFSATELQYMNELVLLEKKKRKGLSIEKSLKRLKELNSTKEYFQTIDSNHFDYLSKWFVFPLKQFFRKPYPCDDIEGIQKKFRMKISKQQVSNAIHILSKLNFLKKSEEGMYFSVEKNINSQNDVPSEAIKNHHIGMMDRAKEAIFEQDIDDREFQSLSFMFNHSEMKEAKEMIRRFKCEFSKKFSKPNGDKISQLNIQFFSHTNRK